MAAPSKTIKRIQDLPRFLFSGQPLYGLLLILLYMSSWSVYQHICNSTELLVYLTADSSLTGSLPNRMFGMFTYKIWNVDIINYLLKALYFITIPTMAFALWLILRSIKDISFRIIGTTTSVFLTYYLMHRTDIWIYTEIYSLGLLISCTLLLYAYCVLAFWKKCRWFSVILASLATLIDFRSVFFIVATALILHLKYHKKLGKPFKVLNFSMFCASFAVSLITFRQIMTYRPPENTNKLDKNAFLCEIYSQEIKNSKLRTHVTSDLTDNVQTLDDLNKIRVDSLAGETISFTDDIQYVIFQDKFQLYVLLTLILILLNNSCEQTDSESDMQNPEKES